MGRQWQMQNYAPAVALTLVAIGAVCRSLSDSSDIGAHLVAALAALAAIIALSVLLDTSPKKGKSARSTDRSEVNEAFVAQVDTSAIRHGYIKRFSQRNGWGLISCEELAGPAAQRSAPGAGKKKRGDHRGDSNRERRDVRVYRADMDAQQLQVGSAVLFRAVPDREAPGWLKAVEVRQHHETSAEEKSAALPESSTTCTSPAKSEEASQDAASTAVPSPESSMAVSAGPSSDSLPQAAPAPAEAEPLQPDAAEAAAEDIPRPATTPVVARRLVHSHLQLPLSQESRAEERNFWKNAVAVAAERKLERRGPAPQKEPDPIPEKDIRTENEASDNETCPKGNSVGHHHDIVKGPSDLRKATDNMRLFSAAVRPVISQAAF
mmetsp:Transcript_77919/g.141702  ORF Transcript_77919/g.141702 Transcript_77919/m.141702 type:complete len:379 (-) Transcript_77919:76-1212(-)